VKKEVLATFEIRGKIERVPIGFVVKKEVEELQGIVQKNVDMSGIPKLVQ
jgi:hypothetical protein